MKINYYFRKHLQQLEIEQACPGCGRIDHLAMHDRVISYVNNKTEFYVGCSCGWMGPTSTNPVLAGIKWEARAIVKELEGDHVRLHNV